MRESSSFSSVFTGFSSVLRALTIQGSPRYGVFSRRQVQFRQAAGDLPRPETQSDCAAEEFQRHPCPVTIDDTFSCIAVDQKLLQERGSWGLKLGALGFLYLHDRHFERRGADAMNCHAVTRSSIILFKEASNPSALSEQFLLPIQIRDYVST